MKHAILSSALLFLLHSSFACSCGAIVSFCECHNKYDLTASCVVADTFPHGISLKVLHVFNGSETKDTIKVWDLGGPYSMCYDSLSEPGRWADIIGDTLLFALPKIDTIKNSWDVIGDYITPGFNCDAWALRVENDTVFGHISGSVYCDFLHNCLTSYSYNAFITDFPTNRLSCETWLNTKELSSKASLNYYPNPASDKIVFTTSEKGMLTITNHFGQVVDVASIMDIQTPILTSNFLTGIYFLSFQTE
jgi:hypothetical protein